MKFFGKVGYIETAETTPGVWSEQLVEVDYYGDVIRDYSRSESTQTLNDNISVNNMISVVADAYAFEHFSTIKYVEWQGSKWKISSVEVKRPRLILYVGELYNEP